MLIHIWKTLKSLSLNMCGEMFFTLLKRPWLIFPTAKATIDATLLTEERFEESHSRDNLANAYKHALWNVLLAHYTLPYFKTELRALVWAQKITDLHEKCFENPDLIQQMDLFNNELGREFYLENFEKLKKLSKNQIADEIYTQTDKMKIIS